MTAGVLTALAYLFIIAAAIGVIYCTGFVVGYRAGRRAERPFEGPYGVLREARRYRREE